MPAKYKTVKRPGKGALRAGSHHLTWMQDPTEQSQHRQELVGSYADGACAGDISLLESDKEPRSVIDLQHARRRMMQACTAITNDTYLLPDDTS